MLMTILQLQSNSVSVRQLLLTTLYLKSSAKNELQLYIPTPSHSSCQVKSPLADVMCPQGEKNPFQTQVNLNT